MTPKLRHPYQWLPEHRQRLVLVLLIFLTALVAWQLGRLGVMLVTPEAPHGIVSIEMAWTVERANEILESWGDERIALVRYQTKWDLLFLALYPLVLSLASAIVARHYHSKAALIGVVFSWSVLVAAPLDLIENIFIFSMLSGAVVSPIPQLATIAAIGKFGLIVATLGYLCVGGAIAFLGHGR